jgi:hypothetical protein
MSAPARLPWDENDPNVTCVKIKRATSYEPQPDHYRCWAK